MLKTKFYIFFFISIAFSSCAQNEKSEQEILQSKINHGKALYAKDCIVCHGQKAEKAYMGEVPPIKDLDFAVRFEMMKQYKNGGLGEKGAYGLANVKQDVMLKLSQDDMEHINLYIETLISEEKNK